MQRWIASTTTATPRGRSTFSSVSAICTVRRSCTWRRRANISTRRGIFERPDHAAVRDVGDVHAAEERDQVVLAEAVEVDVLDEHHLVVGDLEERVVEDRERILRVALGEEAQRLRDPRRACAAARRAPGPRRARWSSLRDELLERIARRRSSEVSVVEGVVARLAHAHARAGARRPRRRPAAAARGRARAMFSAVGTAPANSGSSFSSRCEKRPSTRLPRSRRGGPARAGGPSRGSSGPADGHLEGVVVAVAVRIGALPVEPRGSPPRRGRRAAARGRRESGSAASTEITLRPRARRRPSGRAPRRGGRARAGRRAARVEQPEEHAGEVLGGGRLLLEEAPCRRSGRGGRSGP